jgi:3'-5' exoribonuclease 1
MSAMNNDDLLNPQVHDLRVKLEALGLNIKGTKKQLKQRLRKQKTTQQQPKLRFLLVFDVEATCEADSGFDHDNEIIEFPVVLLDSDTCEIVSCILYLIYT